MHLTKDHFPVVKYGNLKPRVDGPFKVLERIGENAYKFEIPDEYNIFLTLNIKDLWLYHREDLMASLFSQLWGIDTGVFSILEESGEDQFKGSLNQCYSMVM